MDLSQTTGHLRKITLPLLTAAVVIFFLFPWLGNALRWPGRILFFAALSAGIAGSILALIHAARKNSRHLVFTIFGLALAGLLVYGFLELVAFAYLKTRPESNANPFVLTEPQRKAIGKLVQGEPDYTAFDPVLGWSIKPGGVSEDGLYRANAAGFRANREYSPKKPEGVTRVLCFGDSYTHGNSVKNDETWQHFAEAHSSDWEFLNFGVGAYGMTQAYLRYRQVKETFETDVVVLGCMTDNVRRTVNVYYPFRLTRLDATTFALAKPWAALDRSGKLVFHPNPLPSLEAYEQFLGNPGRMMREMARQDLLFESPAPTPLGVVAGDKLAAADFSFFQQRRDELLNRKTPGKRHRKKPNPAFSPGGEIFEINCRLFEDFVHREVIPTGATPLVVWFPSPKDIDRFNRRGDRVYEPFFEFFRKSAIPSVDVLVWLDEAHEGDIPAAEVIQDGHYTPPINRLIGQRLADLLKEALR